VPLSRPLLTSPRPMPTYRVYLECSTRTNRPSGLYDTFISVSAVSAALGEHALIAAARAATLGYAGPYRVRGVQRLDRIGAEPSRAAFKTDIAFVQRTVDSEWPSHLAMRERLDDILAESPTIDAGVTSEACVDRAALDPTHNSRTVPPSSRSQPRPRTRRVRGKPRRR
jgi:hypothetical protein